MTKHLEDAIAPVCFHAMDQALVIQLHAEGRAAVELFGHAARLAEHLQLELDVERKRTGKAREALAGLVAVFEELHEPCDPGELMDAGHTEKCAVCVAKAVLQGGCQTHRDHWHRGCPECERDADRGEAMAGGAA